MTWFAESANATEAAKEHVQLFVAVDFDFTSGHTRLWSGTGTITISGYDYLGVGTLGKISVPAEHARLVVERKTYQLTGVDPSIIADSDIQNCFGRTVTEYFGFLNPSTKALVATPEINWEGRMDQVSRVDGPEPVIEISAEHRMVTLERTSGYLYTDEHQQELWPGDIGFDQVVPSSLKTVLWGGKTVTGSAASSSLSAWRGGRGG